MIDETHKDRRPSTPYAESKLLAENETIIANNLGGLETFVLRQGTIFGTSIGMRFHTSINKFCYLAAMNKPLTVWDSALDSKRPYLGLNDCVRAYEFLERYGKPGEIYNVVTKNFEMREIINTIKQFSPDLKITITKSPILNQKPYHVSNQKIIGLGFEFYDSLLDNVRETINLFKSIKNI